MLTFFHFSPLFLGDVIIEWIRRLLSGLRRTKLKVLKIVAECGEVLQQAVTSVKMCDASKVMFKNRQCILNSPCIDVRKPGSELGLEQNCCKLEFFHCARR